MLKIVRREGSPYWQLAGTYKKVRIRESTGTTDKAQAEQVLARRLREIDDNSITAGGVRTFSQAIDEYIAAGGEPTYLEDIRDVLGHMALTDITQESIDMAARRAYGGYRRGKKGKARKHKPSTIKRQFYIPVSAVLHRAAELGWTTYRRIRAPKVERPPPVWAEPEWFEKLWASCDLQMRVITMFLGSTGCRIQETLDLQLKHLYLAENTAYIPRTKTRAHRSVYLPDELVAALEQWLDGRNVDAGDTVFTYGTRYNFRSATEKACAAAKIPFLSSHKIGGHTYGTYMRRYAGADSRDLVDTGRWANRDMAEHYTHTAVSEASKKAAAIGKLFGTKLTQKPADH